VIDYPFLGIWEEQTVKDRSNQRAAATLGTFVDFADSTFAGTWDLITDGTPVGDFFGLPALTQVCIVSPLGDMYVDTVFETFDYPCFGVTGVAPVFHAAGGSFGDINEFIAQDQSMDILGVTNFYWIGQSTVLSVFNEFADTGFHNEAFDGTGTPGCNAFTALQGIWFWNGRVGSANFTDPFDFVPPPMRSYSPSQRANLPQAYAPTTKMKASDRVQCRIKFLKIFLYNYPL